MKISNIARSLGVMAVLLIGSSALAQTDAGPLLNPWPDQRQRLELATDVFGEADGDIDEDAIDSDFQLSIFDLRARYRFSTNLPINPTVGYEMTYLDVEVDGDILPEHLIDTSIGFATPLARLDDGWFIAAGLGLGYAGDTPFGDSNAWYGKGTAILGRQINETDTLVIGLEYNGNRTVWPDIPLPGFAWTKRLDPDLLMVAGLPFSSVVYEPKSGPMTNWEFELMYTIPDAFGAEIRYQVTEDFEVFSRYDNRNEAFTIADTHNHDRLFFEQERVEAGVRWRPGTYLAFVMAAGYAFDQEFSTGFDLRDTDEVAEPSDEMYGRVGVEWRP